MTTTRTARQPRRCIDCNVQINRSNSSLDNDLCNRCSELAGLENEHQDGYHEDEAVADCLMCNPDARGDRSRTGHSNGVAKTNTSHAGHDHPATKAARAACRKARQARQD